jgi:hypothetical protein
VNRVAYPLLSVLLVALPFTLDTGSGVRVVGALAAVTLAAGYALSTARVLAAGLALAAVAVAAGHDHGVGSLSVGGAAGVLVLLLLTIPADREADAWTLRALAIELPVAIVAAVLASLPIGRLPLLLGAVATAGLVAGTVPADAALRRRGSSRV